MTHRRKRKRDAIPITLNFTLYVPAAELDQYQEEGLVNDYCRDIEKACGYEGIEVRAEPR